MRNILILFMLFVSCKQKTNPISLRQHGTYICAGICKDGILIFADSRSVFQDTDGKVGAYYDGVSKIRRYKDYLLAMAGDRTFTKTTFDEIFDSFKEHPISNISVDSVLQSFFAFAKSKMNTTDYKLLLKNQFLITGYKENYPYIMWSYKNDIKELTTIGDFKSNNKIDDNNRDIKDFFKKGNIYGCQNMMINTITNFITKSNKDTISVFGGKVSSYAIFPNSVVAIANINEYPFSTKKEFYDAYLNNKIGIKYRSINDSISLRNAFLNDN